MPYTRLLLFLHVKKTKCWSEVTAAMRVPKVTTDPQRSNGLDPRPAASGKSLLIQAIKPW